MSLKKDATYNLLGTGIPLIAAAFTIPFMLKSLGNGGFGLLTLIWALIGYFGLFDLGVGRALTYEISRRSLTANKSEIARIIKTGLALTVLTGITGGLAVYYFLAPNASLWLKLTGFDASSARLTFAVAAIGILPTTLTAGLRGALEGLSRFKESNINRCSLGTLMFLVPAVQVQFFSANTIELAVGLVLTRYFVSIIALFQLRHYLSGSYLGKKEEARTLLNFGMWMTLSGIVSSLMVYGDRFFVSAVVGIEALPLYAIPQEGLQKLLIIPAALAGALVPRLAVICSKLDLSRTYFKNLTRVAAVMFLICTLAAITTPILLKYWISNAFSQETHSVVIVLCVGIWWNSLAQIPFASLQARGFAKIVGLVHTLEFLVYALLIYYFSRELGVLGAAFAWSTRAFLDFFLLHFAFVKASTTTD